MSFITVETFNTCRYNHQDANILHTIDTSLIGTHEFSDVKYDFTIIEHTISGSNHTFNFEIVNSNWKGVYYILDGDGDFLDITGTYNNGVLSVTTTEDSIQLVLYCTPMTWGDPFLCRRHDWIFESYEPILCGVSGKHVRLYYNELNGTVSGFEGKGEKFNRALPESIEVSTGSDSDGKYIEFDLNNYYKAYIIGKDSQDNVTGLYYISIVNIKETPKITFPVSLVAGKVNKVPLEIDSVYNGLIKGKATYNGKTVNILSDSTGYYFMLDLTNKRDNNPVPVTIRINENETVNGSNEVYLIPSNFPIVYSEAEFLVELMQGASIIQLGDDVTLTNTVTINHPLLVYGENHTIECDDYNFIVNSNAHFIDTHFNEGGTLFLQSKETKLTLHHCIFTGQKVNNDYHASVIECAIDIPSLNNPRDYNSTVKECLFVNCENTAIRHGGLLTVDNTRYYTDLEVDNLYTIYPSFLYMVDGDALIQDSIFDIDTDDTCTLDMDLKYVPALFMVGETASVNNNDYLELKNAETINFFNGPYNNRSHILVDYLFDEIDDCVYLSPTLDLEDKALCYALSGDDYLYKQNVQVTRKSWGTENRNKKIIWDDI